MGGAILNYYSEITIEDSSFVDNAADHYGGALANTGNIYIQDTLFEDNTAQKGGAIYTYTSAHTEGDDCQFTNNAPNDIENSNQESVSYANTVDFVCDGGGCTEL